MGISLSLSQFNSLSLFDDNFITRARSFDSINRALFFLPIFFFVISLSLLVEDVFATHLRAQTEKEVMLVLFSLNDVSAVLFWREERRDFWNV